MIDRYHITLFAALLLLAGCASTPSVYSDFDPRHDFTTHKTFTWAQQPPMLSTGDYPISSLAEYQISSAIKSELMLKGYNFVEDENDADFAVVYTMGARDKIDLVRRHSPYYSHNRYWGWGGYYYPYFVHFPFDHDPSYYEEIDEYTKGTIALDIFNAKNKRPIWHTHASKRLSMKELKAPEESAEVIAKNLLKHFPEIQCEVEESRKCRPFKVLDDD